MTKSREIDRLLAEESAEWTERLRHGDRRTRAEFATWSRKSPLHMRHFLMMVALDHELERIDPDKRIPLPPPAARESADVVDLAAHHTTAAEAKPARRRMLGWWALAASMLLAVSAFLYAPQFIYRAQGWTEYSTALGEQRAVELPDGSIAHLNTNSEILVRLSGTERQVRLLSGEALFKVHHDTTRPFRVYTDDATIQAVGTQFNVYRQAEGTRVSVLEGRVKVTAEESATAPSATESTGSSGSVGSASPTKTVSQPEAPSIKLLTVGESAEVRQDGTITKTEVVDVSAMASWRQRRLVFKQDALATVITEFNRYNQTPQFRLVGADVASRRYSGAFDADDPESLIALLSIDKDLQIQRNGGEIVIRSRNPATNFAQSP